MICYALRIDELRLYEQKTMLSSDLSYFHHSFQPRSAHLASDTVRVYFEL